VSEIAGQNKRQVVSGNGWCSLIEPTLTFQLQLTLAEVMLDACQSVGLRSDMARSIQVMLSSRCRVDIPGDGGRVTLSSVRIDLKKQIEQLLLVDGTSGFDVWINEEGGPGPGDESSWDYCLTRARACDLFVSIFDGQSGWMKVGESEGICEAELETAVDSNPSKVRIVRLEPLRPRKGPSERASDSRYKQYVEGLDRFWATATDAPSLRKHVLETVQTAVVEMALRGAYGGPAAKAYLGQALDWNRLNFAERKAKIEVELAQALGQRPGSRPIDEQTVVTPIGSRPVLVRCAGLPAPVGVAAARELVGQPFLKDHELVGVMRPGEAGPVHLIGCHAGVTDSQARRQLGFPDAIVVTTPQGVWVADPIQNIQVLFLRNCVDAVSTRVRLQNALEWLDQSGEDEALAERAAKRARIARAVAKEVA
jgi:uncharacterized protein DUF4062